MNQDMIFSIRTLFPSKITDQDMLFSKSGHAFNLYTRIMHDQDTYESGHAVLNQDTIPFTQE